MLRTLDCAGAPIYRPHPQLDCIPPSSCSCCSVSVMAWNAVIAEGWRDVDLSLQGAEEARLAGTVLKACAGNGLMQNIAQGPTIGHGPSVNSV